MPSFLEVQTATRAVTIVPFPDTPQFVIDVQEKMARDPKLEKDQRALFERYAKEGEAGLKRAYRILESVANIPDEEVKEDVASEPEVKPKKKTAKKGEVVVAEDTIESDADYLSTRDPLTLYNEGRISKENAEQMAILQVTLMNMRNDLLNNPRHNLCVAVCARVTDWNLTYDGDLKIPLDDAQTLNDFTDTKGNGVSTQLLQAILTAIDEAPLIPKARS